MTEEKNIEALLQERQVFTPGREFVAGTLVPDYERYYELSMRDVEAYWDRVAGDFEWIRRWEKVLDWRPPNAKWFAGARCNITANCLDRHLRSERRNKIALLWLGEDGTERVFSFAMLHRAVCKLASGLKSLGIGKGDRVAIYMPLTPEGIITMLACARIGAIHSVIYAGLGAGAIRDRIEDASAKAVVCTDVGFRRGKTVALKPMVDEALAGATGVEHVIVHRRGEPKPQLAAREIDFDELLENGSADCPPEEMDSEDWLFILYTSGSTGKPKGCAFVHGGYMVGTAHLWKLLCDVHDHDVYWCTSDIGWIVGHSIMVYGPWCNGTTVVVREGTPDYPHAGIIWETIERYGVTKMFTAPTALRMFMRLGAEWPKRYDLSSLRLLACAGEPLNPEALRWAHEHVMQGRGPVLDNWWQTETAAPVIGTFPSYTAKAGKVGKPFPGYRVEILTADGKPVPPNTGGLLCLDGPWPCMFRTVWGAPERYEEYFNRIPGMYVAGDVATRDEDGYIAVLGRADDVLNVAGHRIGTADVESALVSHPAVGEAAVIGKPDAIKGESIKAFVLLRAGREPSDELRAELVEHVRHVLGPIATPSELEFATTLPKTRSGKIMRRVLKARELGQDVGDLTTIEQ
jgi:acetyl-CoA synthetase